MGSSVTVAEKLAASDPSSESRINYSKEQDFVDGKSGKAKYSFNAEFKGSASGKGIKASKKQDQRPSK